MNRRLSEHIRSSIERWTIEYRVHATQQMFKRHIEQNDIAQLLAEGEIIEEYPEDFPFPSVLINGISDKSRPLHCVVAIDADFRRLYLITVYEPDPERWTDSYKKRILP